MDFINYSRYNPTVWLALILAFGALLLPANSSAESDILKNFSFDDCDPFEARALVMEINGKKAQLVAAEQTIYVVDLFLGDLRLTTELTDADGNHMDFGSLSRGQWVYIKGFKHINGGVVASQVQRIDPPERKKPVLRKLLNKKSHRQRRTTRRSGL
jgi:hypothetical protein